MGATVGEEDLRLHPRAQAGVYGAWAEGGGVVDGDYTSMLLDRCLAVSQLVALVKSTVSSGVADTN